eukprot:530877-Amorphochlora_amoeboformis.AAC.1
MPMNVDGRRCMSMDVDGRQRTSMDVDVRRCMSMDVDGRRCMSMMHVHGRRYASPWTSMDVDGRRCMSMDVDGRRCMSMHVHACRSTRWTSIVLKRFAFLIRVTSNMSTVMKVYPEVIKVVTNYHQHSTNYMPMHNTSMSLCICVH